MIKKNLGIMGGTFDPIHNGHLLTSEAVRQSLRLEKVLFIPAYIAPHKMDEQTASAEDRLRMVELGTAYNPHFSVSPMEIDRGGVSYTYDTVKRLYDEYGSRYRLFFIIGADSAPQLKTWHRVQELVELCTFAAMARPGFAFDRDLAEKMFGPQHRDAISWIYTPVVDVSSTEIRTKIKQGITIENLVPRTVAEYIRQKDLYRG